MREEITGSYTQGGAFSPALGSRVFSYADDDTTAERNIYDLPDYSEPTSSPAPQVNIYYYIYYLIKNINKLKEKYSLNLLLF